ncbi:hypothetical protein QJS04_geneDACA015038 [Acorus gramineus]|uniref:Uncharacterized protein n=1 Tax=Acorus gramineus TaxID=55184 RepID=A0AAV9BXI8_ACOGR|nr:hypothetical protein QJS04_geneDACA015038 [Acorus gramineus]
MFRVLCKNLLGTRSLFIRVSTTTTTTSTHLWFLENPNPKSISHITKQSKSSDPSSTTVPYLINSCGLSPTSALKASKGFRIKSTENADSVLAFLKNHGFTNTQLTQMITRFPKLLACDPDDTMKPKMEFFLHEAGVAPSELTELILLDPKIMEIGLENHIKPSFEFLNGLFGTNENVLLTFKRNPSLFRHDLHKCLDPKIASLRDCGMPMSLISKFIKNYSWSIVFARSDRFSEVVASVKEMGISSLSHLFISAVHTRLSMSTSTWEGKIELYKSLGWSEDKLLSTFKKHPYCMVISEKKLRKVMEFFVKELGWEPSDLNTCPAVLSFSFEKRILPRCSVIQVLSSKGVLRKDLKQKWALMIDEKTFLEKYVNKYRDVAPELMQVYQDRMGS